VKYQVIRGISQVDDFEGDADGFEAFAQGLGLKVVGRTSNDLALPQRRNQPILDGFLEPFGSGDGLRYEDRESHKFYSN
jgi:hypothetical protein